MYLSNPSKVIWLFMLFVGGLFPCMLFFSWVENDCRHPYLENLPLYDFKLSFPARAVFNLMLFFIFGFFHTLLAQLSVISAMKRFFPSQTIRALFVISTGLSFLLVVVMWQPFENSVLWAFPLFSRKTNEILRFVLFNVCFATIISVVMQHGLPSFYGIQQLFESDKPRVEATPVLIKTGLYGISRHPIYTFTVLGFVLSPIVDLNRLLIVLATSIYLYFAVPIEEKKLVKQFGKAYVQYQQEVPQVVPFFKMRSGEKAHAGQATE